MSIRESPLVKRPHIVLFNPDQWRGDVLGHMGNPAASTPVLDRAVETDFVSFRGAFCQNPVCTPSRCSFMSGWYPHVHGHRTMYHMLRSHEPVLLKTLKDSGYDVWWGGKNDLVPAELGYADFCTTKYEPQRRPMRMWGEGEEWRGKRGSDTFYSFYVGRIPVPAGVDHYPDPDWANVLGAVEKITAHRGENPLCIYLPLTYPHPPYGVEEPWFSRIDRTRLPPRTSAPGRWEGLPSLLAGIHERQNMSGWSEERWSELRATYYGMCARVDHQFGRVLQALRDAGIYDDTLVLFFSDHGDFTGDYGLVEKTQNTFEDCLTRVPFLAKLPASYRSRHGVVDALVELPHMPTKVTPISGGRSCPS
jgi:arylsulfatase A-like enzyme